MKTCIHCGGPKRHPRRLPGLVEWSAVQLPARWSMTERAQALEAAIEKARQGLIGFAAEIQDGRVPVVGAVRDHLVLNLGLIASFLADALLAVPPPPPVGSPTTEALGLSIDMLDADRLQKWADNIEAFGPDLTQWASSVFVSQKCRELSVNIAQAVRDIGILRQSTPVEPAGASEPPSEDEPCQFTMGGQWCIVHHGYARTCQKSPTPVSPVEPTPEPPSEDVEARIERLTNEHVAAFWTDVERTRRAIEASDKPTGEPAPCVWRDEGEPDFQGVFRPSCRNVKPEWFSDEEIAGWAGCPYCLKPLTVER